jgi:hypothetical protein
MKFRMGVLLGILFCAMQLHAENDGVTWHAGTWDSTLYAWSDPIHPRTVAIRIEIVDSGSLLAIPGAQIRLKGSYFEEHLGRFDDLSTPRTQRKEYELTVRTGDDGVAVLALPWQKEYPWSQERPKVYDRLNPGSWQDAESWVRPVDGLEKIQAAELRHARYIGRDIGLDFKHLLECGQNAGSEFQTAEVLDRFNKAWRSEMRNQAVRFCVIKPSATFSDYGNKNCNREDFFGRIRRKDFGIVYEEPANLTGLSPKEYCGPYFVYLVQLALEPDRNNIVVALDTRANAAPREDPVPSNEDVPRRSPRPQGNADAIGDQTGKQPPPSREPIHQKPAMQTVTNELIREKGLYLGTKGVFLNEPMGGLPAGIVIETVQHRVAESADKFRQMLKDREKDGSVAVGIWQRKANGKWERQDMMFVISK